MTLEWKTAQDNLANSENRMLTLTLLASLLTTQPAVGAGQKVAYVDMARALNEVNDGKNAKAKLKKEFEARQKQLDAEQSRLKRKKADFDKRVATMRPEVRSQKEQELQRELMALQQTYVQMQRELMGQEGKVTQEIGERLKSIIGKIGDRDGYTMILNIGESVLYHKRHMNITDEVVTVYNKKFAKK